jgi:hypothetical protein
MTFEYPAFDLIMFKSVDLPVPFGPAITISAGTASHFAYLMLRWFRTSNAGMRTVCLHLKVLGTWVAGPLRHLRNPAAR